MLWVGSLSHLLICGGNTTGIRGVYYLSLAVNRTICYYRVDGIALIVAANPTTNSTSSAYAIQRYANARLGHSSARDKINVNAIYMLPASDLHHELLLL